MNTYLLRITNYILHFLFPVFCFVACESYPKDPNNTLEKAKQAQLRIGAMHAPPWVIIEGNTVTGTEAEIVQGFAQKIQTDIDWIIGSESELMSLLEAYELHIVIGGLTTASPWKQQVALTNPYSEVKIMVGAPQDMPIPDNIKGKEVGVRKNSVIAVYVKQNKGKPVLLDSTALREYDGLIADDEHRLQQLPVKIADWSLATEKHVMAVPKGENHFLVTLEKYLNETGY